MFKKVRMFKKKNEKLQQLERIPLLRDFGTDELRTISKHAQLMTYEPGSTLIEDGQVVGESALLEDESE